MSVCDLLRRIADARANMMIRGFDELHVEIGQVTLSQLRSESSGTQPIFEDGKLDRFRLLGMPGRVVNEMEGFTVRSAKA